MVAEPIYLHERQRASTEPFAKMPLAVLARRDLSHGAKVAYAALRSFAWDEGHCHPGIEAVAERMGSSARRVWAYLRELEEKGLVTGTRRGQGQTKTYTLRPAHSQGGQDSPEVTSLDSPFMTNQDAPFMTDHTPDSPEVTILDSPEVTILDSPEVANRIDTVKVDTVKVDTDNTIAPLRQGKDGQSAMPADPPPDEDVDLARELCLIIGMNAPSKASVASMVDVVQEFRPLVRRPLEAHARSCAAFHDAKPGKKRAPNVGRLRNWLDNEVYGFRKKDGTRSEPAARPAPVVRQGRPEQRAVSPEEQAIRDRQASLERLMAAEKDWYNKLLAEQPEELTMMQRCRRVSTLLEADPHWRQKARVAAGL